MGKEEKTKGNLKPKSCSRSLSCLEAGGEQCVGNRNEIRLWKETCFVGFTLEAPLVLCKYRCYSVKAFKSTVIRNKTR